AASFLHGLALHRVPIVSIEQVLYRNIHHLSSKRVARTTGSTYKSAYVGERVRADAGTAPGSRVRRPGARFRAAGHAARAASLDAAPLDVTTRGADRRGRGARDARSDGRTRGGRPAGAPPGPRHARRLSRVV